MKRKYIYPVLAAPLLVLAVILLALPADTRSTFFSEFGYRTKTMFGYELPPVKGEDGKDLGLRSESPEEYGGPGGELDPSAEAGGEESKELSSVSEPTTDTTAP